MILVDYELRKEDLDVFSHLLSIAGVSIIVVNPKKEAIKALGKDELGLELKRIDFEGAKMLLQKRIEAAGGSGIWPFNEKQLKDLCGLADYVPSRILALCAEKAKELAVEVKSGKLKKPEKEKKHSIVEHAIHYENKDVQHPPVEKKHGGSGFGIKFTIIDDEKPASASEKLAPKVSQAVSATVSDDVMVKHDANEEEQSDQQSAELKNVQEKKTTKKLEKATKPANTKPAKQNETQKAPHEEPEKKAEKEDDGMIIIDLGLADITPKKESKVVRGEEVVVDVKKKK
jgi:hypothetical protein